MGYWWFIYGLFMVYWWLFDVLLMAYWWLIDGFWWFLMVVWWVLMDFYGCLLVRWYKVTNNIPFVQVFSRLLAENDRKKCVFWLKTASWSTLAPLEHPSSTLLFLWISVLKHQKVLKCCNFSLFLHVKFVTSTVGTYPRVCPKYTHPPMDIRSP